MSIRSLTIHIGLPKTMTTTLQRHIFPRFPGYVGRYYTPGGNTTDGDEFWHHAISAWRNGDDAWEVGLRSVVSQIASRDARDVFFSHEALSQWFTPGRADPWPFKDGDVLRRQGPHPVGEFLAVLASELGSSVQVRAIVTLRNQSEFMASLYAQNAAWNSSYCQADFERRVNDIVFSRDCFFRWDELVDCLDATVGPENCLVLFHEDGLQVNVTRIAEFLGVPAIKLSDDPLIENRRNNGSGSWESPVQHVQIARKSTLFAPSRYFSQSLRLLVRQHELLRRPLRRVDRFLATLFGKWRRRRRSIRLRSNVAASVRAGYSDANRRLELRVGRSLSPFGY